LKHPQQCLGQRISVQGQGTMQRLLGRGWVVSREGGDSTAQTAIGSALSGQQ
jgi:hypothetical protein